jgi:hypothetical protein
MHFLLFAVLLFSFNNVLWKKNIVKSSIEFLVAYRAVFNTFFYCGGVFINITEISISSSDYLKITAGSILGTIGLFSMLLFLKKSSLQWVGIYNLIGIAITTVYVWIFEELEISSVLLGGVFILLGFGWFLHANSTNSIQLNIRQHLLLSLMTIAFSSSSLIHWKNLTGNISPLVIISNQESIVLLTSFVLLLRKTNLSRIKTDIGQNFIPILSMSVVLLGAFSCSLLGLKITNPIISGMIFLTSPLTTILFSSYFFKETISKQNWLAISIISVGAFLLHLQTS